MLFCLTYARHKIRHGIRHTAARAGQRPRPYVLNDRLRHGRIGDARVSEGADGSQSLDLQCDALQVEGVAAKSTVVMGEVPSPNPRIDDLHGGYSQFHYDQNSHPRPEA